TVTMSSLSELTKPVSRSSGTSSATKPSRVTVGVPLASKLEPKINTRPPAGPLLIGTLVIVGAGNGSTVKPFALTAIPAGVMTLTLPVVAPTGTATLISVGNRTSKPGIVPDTG